jgi:hypothetical protein
MPQIAANFSDATYAIGAADALIETCDYLSCAEPCLHTGVSTQAGNGAS